MHDLDLIRAATEDVASARMLLQERTEALSAIIQTALEHGFSMDEIAAAGRQPLIGNEKHAGAPQQLLEL